VGVDELGVVDDFDGIFFEVQEETVPEKGQDRVLVVLDWRLWVTMVGMTWDL
jgi:hypothetical protein